MVRDIYMCNKDGREDHTCEDARVTCRAVALTDPESYIVHAHVVQCATRWRVQPV